MNYSRCLDEMRADKMAVKPAFKKDYLNNAQLRRSFFALAHEIFKLDFETWYHTGNAGNYIPYSFADQDKVIANVSVNKLDLIVSGKPISAIQIGTVMTHPVYRNRGLSTQLLNKVLEDHFQTEIIYLFANRHVVDFYPKFGFEAVEEYDFSAQLSSTRSRSLQGTGVKKLDPANQKDAAFLKSFISERRPVSRVFGTADADGILMYHCLNTFSDDIYYLEEENAVIIYQYHREERQIEIFDLITPKEEVNIQEIISKIVNDNLLKIIFHYTPDYQGFKIESNLRQGSEVLFMKTNGSVKMPAVFKHPVTSQA